MKRPVEVTWHEHDVTREDRERLMGHCGCVVWFTGLSGSGKSTIANAVDRLLYARGVHTMLLDGDNVRHGLNASGEMLHKTFGDEFANRFGLGFGPDDRNENIRRIGAVSQLFCAAGIVTLTAFVSPYRRDRDLVREWVNGRGRATDFFEVYVAAALDVCEARDPKGLYQKARRGEIPDFTGIGGPYEEPVHPELTLQSGSDSVQACAERVVRMLEEFRVLRVPM